MSAAHLEARPEVLGLELDRGGALCGWGPVEPCVARERVGLLTRVGRKGRGVREEPPVGDGRDEVLWLLALHQETDEAWSADGREAKRQEHGFLVCGGQDSESIFRHLGCGRNSCEVRKGYRNSCEVWKTIRRRPLFRLPTLRSPTSPMAARWGWGARAAKPFVYNCEES